MGNRILCNHCNHFYIEGAESEICPHYNKEKMVMIPKDIMDELPEEYKPEFEEIFDKLAKGEIEGDPMDIQPILLKLVCGKCDSRNISWSIDTNSNEVYYHCHNCKEHGWMTLEEYVNAIKKYPESIFVEVEEDEDENK